MFSSLELPSRGMSYRSKHVILTSFQKQGSFDTYISEARSIRESTFLKPLGESEECEEDSDAFLLKRAGFENIVTQLESGQAAPYDFDSKTAALPRAHAAAIRKRMDSFRTTMKTRHGPDLKTVFKSQGAPSTGSPPPAPPPSENAHPLFHNNSSVNFRASPAPPSYAQTMAEVSTRSMTPTLARESEEEDIKLHFGGPPQSTTSLNSWDQLPNFTISQDALGITHISDLTRQSDLDKIRVLALLELTVTLDDHNIPLRTLRATKAKAASSENVVFGVPLSMLLANDRKRDPQATIPLVFIEMLSFLEDNGLLEEGILRIPGSLLRINSIIQEIESTFNTGLFSFEGKKCVDVSSCLKQFLRDLPVPLLTKEYLPTFASLVEIDELKEQVRTLNLLILLLPSLHQRALKRLLEFCEAITKHSDQNKMDLMNIAMVIAPNLFFSLPSMHGFDDVAMAANTTHIVRLLIKYHDLLWTVPGEMLKQVRYLYDLELKRLNHKAVMKAIKEMQHKSVPTGRRHGHESAHHIIRVQAPLFTRVSMAVNISEFTTAGEIVQKLVKCSHINRVVLKKRYSNSSIDSLSSSQSSSEDNSGSMSPEEDVKQFLFEVGGNIGERCLHDDTDVQLLCSTNPNATWFIKPKDEPLDLV